MTRNFKISLLFIVAAFYVSKSSGQVYKKPDGTADKSIPSSYKKVTVPDSLQAFYNKINTINDLIRKNYNERGNSCDRLYYGGFANLYLPNIRQSVALSDQAAGAANDFYYDFTSAIIKGDNNTFLTKINPAVNEVEKVGYDMNLNIFFHTGWMVDCIGSNSLDNSIKKISRDNSIPANADMAIMYITGPKWRTQSEAKNGNIDPDYQKSLSFADQLGQKKTNKKFNSAYSFIYKATRMYDLLKLGTAEKNLDKLKQASDLQIELWQMFADKSQRQQTFSDLLPITTTYVASFNKDLGINGNDYANLFSYNGQFDPYFVSAVKIQLLNQIQQCCYQIQMLSPDAVLSNGAKPQNFAVSAYKSFINDFE